MGSRSITFRHTWPLAGWGLAVHDRVTDGRRRFTVQLEARLADGTIRAGYFSYQPGQAGYDVMVAAYDDHGVEPMHEAALHLVGVVRELLGKGALPEAKRAHWQPVMDAADAAQAAYAARYPDGVPAFEVIHTNYAGVLDRVV